MTLLVEVKKQLEKQLENLGQSRLTPSYYDTAWVAMLGEKKPIFPKSLDFLLKNQNADGSWGASGVINYQDRIISTLATILTLNKYKRNSNFYKNALNYVNKNIDKVDNEPRDTVGFELIFTSLIQECSKKDIKINTNSKTVDKYFERKDLKLSKIPLKYIYKNNSVLSYSLEFVITEKVDYSKLLNTVEDDDNFGNSPALVSLMYEKTRDERLLNYLRKIIDKEGKVADFYSINNFEVTWSLISLVQNNLFGDMKNKLFKYKDYLKKRLTSSGISFADKFPVVDLDITVATLRILHEFGEDIDLSILENFETEEGYYCYKGELDASATHIGNMIRLLRIFDNPQANRMRNKAEIFLKKILNGTYSDKWNTSIYYSYSRIPKFDLKISSYILNQIKLNQNRDGSWGEDSNIDETIWALQAYFEHADSYNKYLLRAAYKYLNKEIFSESKEFWISKVLYSPLVIQKVNNYSTYIKLSKILENEL